MHELLTLESSRDNHYNYCIIRIKIPQEGPMISFCNGQNQFKVPFIMYTDFESILEPIQGPSLVPTGSYTLQVTKHSPSGWCVYSKFAHRKLRTHQNSIEVKIVLGNFVITSEKKLIGYTTCFLKNQWILQLQSNGRNIKSE